MIIKADRNHVLDGLSNHALLALSVTLSLLYLYASTISDNSIISRQAHFEVDIPFKFRFLTPWVISVFAPDQYLDIRFIKFLIATGASYWILKAMPSFAEGILPRTLGSKELQFTAWAMMIFHYCIPRELNVYYVYDFPAILFYMYATIGLMRHPSKTWPWILVVIASLNRETIWIALIHVATFKTLSKNNSKKEKIDFLTRAAFTTGAIVLIRIIANTSMGEGFLSNATPMEGDHLRILQNLRRISSEKAHTHQLFMLGMGMVLWLPWALRKTPSALRQLHVASIPPIALLLWTGNVTELRMYNEFIPLWSTTFAAFLFGSHIPVVSETKTTLGSTTNE